MTATYTKERLIREIKETIRQKVNNETDIVRFLEYIQCTSNAPCKPIKVIIPLSRCYSLTHDPEYCDKSPEDIRKILEKDGLSIPFDIKDYTDDPPKGTSFATQYNFQLPKELKIEVETRTLTFEITKDKYIY